MTRRAVITVVGIGADGWRGLGEPAREAIGAAALLVGSSRQLALIPGGIGGERKAWPSPIDALVADLAAGALGAATVLASGDPMLHGIGATLARRGASLQVVPHPSAFALACARMGWPEADARLVSAIGRPEEVVVPELQRGRRIVVYTTDAARLAGVLAERGFGASAFTVLEQLGGPRERRTDLTAADATAFEPDPLHAVAIEVAGAPGLPRTPGLPDEAFASDGQLTKRHVRALTLAALAPRPHELLWDVGAGSGSIAIEWLRAEPTARAIAIEARADRALRAERNAVRLGVPRLDVLRRRAPEGLRGLEAPGAVFIGGGITAPGVVESAWSALRPGGRLVANVVTLEGEQVLARARSDHGGALTRIDVAHAEPVGGFTGWRAQMTVTQWVAEKHAP